MTLGPSQGPLEPPIGPLGPPNSVASLQVTQTKIQRDWDKGAFDSFWFSVMGAVVVECLQNNCGNCLWDTLMKEIHIGTVPGLKPEEFSGKSDQEWLNLPKEKWLAWDLDQMTAGHMSNIQWQSRTIKIQCSEWQREVWSGGSSTDY